MSQPARFRLWLAAMALLLVYFGLHTAPNLKLDSNLLAMLPSQERDPGAERASRRISDAFARRLLFLVGAEDYAQARTAAAGLAASLQASPAFDRVQFEPDAGALRPSAAEHAARFGLVSAADRARLAAGGAEALRDEALRALYSPAGFARLTAVVDDPLGLFDHQLRTALPVPGRATLEGGVLAIHDGAKVWLLVLAETRDSPFSQAIQQPLAAALKAARAAAETAGAEVLVSGVAPHAVAASARARAEMVWLGGGDLLACALLMLAVFRSLRPALLGLLSVGLGIVAALCLVQALFGSLHFLTLVFGTSLIGVAVDYAIHFLCDQFRDPQHWRPSDAPAHIGPSLLLGLGTAVLGYAAFATAPLPVLRQMAVFSATGLSVAAASVWLAFPTLARPAAMGGGERWLRLAGLLRPRRAPWWFWLLLVALAVPGLLRLKPVDDLRQLQSSPPALIAEEQRVRALLGSNFDSRHFLIEGGSEQQLLEREEALTARLDALRLSDYTAVSRALPSLKTQDANRALLAPLLLPQGLIARHLAALGYGPEPAARLAAEFTLAPRLEPATALSNDRLKALTALWLGEDGGVWRSAVTLSSVRDASALAAIAADLPGVQWHDPVAETTAVLASQRQEALRRLGLIYLLIAVVLTVRYGPGEGLRALAAPLGASLLTLAALGWCGLPLNLFTVLALLLVLGIGNDYVIFLREGVRAGAPPAASRLAVGLAAMTTLLSFGGLAFSSTPFLQSLGLTLALGIATTLTLALFTAPLDSQPPPA